MTPSPTEPSPDCPLCPRLHDFISAQRAKEPDWFNAPVPTMLPPAGIDSVRLLIAGLAPGMRGANRTGRPFTGDYAGDLLYATLKRFDFARGQYEARPDDSLVLHETAISNSVRCVPPQNKPLPAEINTCRRFLIATMAQMHNVKTIVTLGTIAHQSTIKALGQRLAVYPFKHGARYDIGSITLFPSYHCSRYNTNTGVLTDEMFAAVFAAVRAKLGPAAGQRP